MLGAPAGGCGPDLGEEQCHPATLRSQGVAKLAADPLDETLTLESAQIVAHLAGGVLGVWQPEQLGHQRAEPSVGDSFRREHEQAERSEERGHAWIPEPEGGSWLTPARCGSRQSVHSAWPG